MSDTLRQLAEKNRSYAQMFVGKTEMSWPARVVELSDALDDVLARLDAAEERLRAQEGALDAVAQEIPFTSLTPDTAQKVRAALARLPAAGEGT